MPITVSYPNGTQRSIETWIDDTSINPFKRGLDFEAFIGPTTTSANLLYGGDVYASITNLSTAEIGYQIGAYNISASYPYLRGSWGIIDPIDADWMFSATVWEVDRRYVFSEQDDYIILDAVREDTEWNMTYEAGQLLSVDGKGGEDTVHLPHWSIDEIEITKNSVGNYQGMIKAYSGLDEPIELFNVEYVQLADGARLPLNESHPSFKNIVNDSSNDAGGSDRDDIGKEDPVEGVIEGLTATVSFPVSHDQLVRTAAGYSVDGVPLLGMQRIQFSDTHIALDLDGPTSAGGIYRLYKAAFNREPDSSGLGYWIAQADQGKSAVGMAEDFTWSNEFQSVYGIATRDNFGTGADVSELVTGFYGNVLGRAPDQGGLNYYAGAIESRDKSVGRVLAEIADSPENYAATIDLIQNGIQYDLWVG